MALGIVVKRWHWQSLLLTMSNLILLAMGPSLLWKGLGDVIA